MDSLPCNAKSPMVYLALLSCIVISSSLFLAHADQHTLALKKNGQPVRVAIYSGEGTYFRSIKAATRMFLWMGAEPQRIKPREIIDGQLKSFDILYMTGGWAVPYIRDLKNGGTAKIRQFVQEGGAYIGTCAGAFFAADYIYWEGKRYEYPLDLFPGSARGPIAELAPWPGFKLCRINLSQKYHAITNGEPASMMSLYYGAPWFDVPPGFKADVLATYDINNRPAILAYEFGQGRVFLTGLHTEFEEGSDRDNVLWDNGLNDPESEWPLMLNAVRWLVGHEN
ncbi:MAG: Type 1 glutamine amidotransferase-like domain-containing protein [Desulfobacterales bacterium]|nr:MAG: Type 1 glutamine amidotransferase-like domain-containing protein [Desulfobacterales bacterium]